MGPLRLRHPVQLCRGIEDLVAVSLTRLLLAFARRHWRAYAASALMLVGVALLTVWIPRQVGHIVDAL
ncbi:MAG: hypothetical protein RMK97_07725, partial [Sutterellaceae bacterium]|nr:hypothetical protein [Burkholderiaceae bacterium]MDW8430374.1 hypothetical protein [Sutterellaceae bacterium]